MCENSNRTLDFTISCILLASSSVYSDDILIQYGNGLSTTLNAQNNILNRFGNYVPTSLSAISISTYNYYVSSVELKFDSNVIGFELHVSAVGSVQINVSN